MRNHYATILDQRGVDPVLVETITDAGDHLFVEYRCPVSADDDGFVTFFMRVPKGGSCEILR